MRESTEEVKLRDLFKTWWPIALSWVLLSFEPQLFSSVISRYPNAEVNLAAYGNVSWLIPIFIQSPIMLLQIASAALCTDLETFKKLRKFAYGMSIGLTLVHLLVALTPLYFFITRELFNLPEEVIAAARPGLILMLPWAGSIAYRRFHQGILVRFGHTKRMSFGTLLRLLSDLVCVLLLSRIEGISGLIVATAAQGFSVFVEGVFIGVVTRPIVKQELKKSITGEIIRWKTFIRYYTPLLVNSVLLVLYSPMNSAAMGRMPASLSSLATWPVVNSFSHLVKNLGQACREVTLTFIRKKDSFQVIRKFSLIVGAMSVSILIFFTFTPLLNWYLGDVISMPAHLLLLAKNTMIFFDPDWNHRFFYEYVHGHRNIQRENPIPSHVYDRADGRCFNRVTSGIFVWPHEGIFVIAAVSLLAATVQLIWLFFVNRKYVAGR